MLGEQALDLVGARDARRDGVGAAAKSGKATEISSLATKVTTDVGGGITALTTGLATATVELTTLEAAAKAALEAPAAGSGSAAGSGDAVAGDFMAKLTTGFELKGAATGIEAGLVKFIEDATNAAAIEEKKTWFTFDRLTFAEGKAELDAEKSKDQLANMVEILKAFPTVKLKIGGYTDSTGSADANKKISGERAKAVMTALVDLGIAADRLEAEGYGPEFPKCAANDTDDCKAQNRRIALRVTAK